MRAWLAKARPSPTKSRAALAAALAIAGLSLVVQGAWIPAKAMLAQILLERAFASSLVSGRPVKPWSWFCTWPVARIEVPRLHRSLIALEGSSGQALAFGPGHVAGTPQAGEQGFAVYAAHRDTQFAFLGEVAIGDEIRVTRVDGMVIAFRVIATSVVPWDDSGLDANAPRRRLVLSTCWPLRSLVSGPLRYLVEAERMDDRGGGAG